MQTVPGSFNPQFLPLTTSFKPRKCTYPTPSGTSIDAPFQGLSVVSNWNNIAPRLEPSSKPARTMLQPRFGAGNKTYTPLINIWNTPSNGKDRVESDSLLGMVCWRHHDRGNSFVDPTCVYTVLVHAILLLVLLEVQYVLVASFKLPTSTFSHVQVPITEWRQKRCISELSDTQVISIVTKSSIRPLSPLSVALSPC